MYLGLMFVGMGVYRGGVSSIYGNRRAITRVFHNFDTSRVVNQPHLTIDYWAGYTSWCGKHEKQFQTPLRALLFESGGNLRKNAKTIAFEVVCDY